MTPWLRPLGQKVNRDIEIFDVCVQHADHAKLIDEGSNGVALTACPTSGVAGGNNPACSAPPFLELPPRRADPPEGSPRYNSGDQLR